MLQLCGFKTLILPSALLAAGACSSGEQSGQLGIEYVHFDDYDPSMNMPYTPAIKVDSGTIVFLSGVTAAPVYHSHPHVISEFDGIPSDATTQAEMTMENLQAVLEAAGGEITDVIQLNRFIVDIEQNQDAINAVAARYLGDHRPASTTVEVPRLATDPRLVLEIEAVAVVP
jgi:enamine deaminase RidA (YjgF/YER057c/UK114 family)